MTRSMTEKISSFLWFVRLGFNLLTLFLLGVTIGLIVANNLVDGELMRKTKTQDQPCPHGWVYWEDCPVCSH